MKKLICIMMALTLSSAVICAACLLIAMFLRRSRFLLRDTRGETACRFRGDSRRDRRGQHQDREHQSQRSLHPFFHPVFSFFCCFIGTPSVSIPF